MFRTLHLDWSWVLMAGVAVYGALLSTYNTYIARKQHTRQISVAVSYGFLTHGSNPSEEMLLITASNPSQRSVTLTSVGFLLPTTEHVAILAPAGTQLPHHLTEGTNVTNWMSTKGLAEVLRGRGFSGGIRIAAFYNDALNGQHISKRLLFDIDRLQ